ncbi:MAG: phosphoglucosamine mutase [Phycisphaeraceae bacterium]
MPPHASTSQRPSPPPAAAPAPLMLGVSGTRGIVGQSLTPEIVTRYAAAVGSHLRQVGGVAQPHVVVGRDSRPSGPMCEAAAMAGLLAVGCRVTQLGVATTPGTAIMIDHLGADGGLVITASHNPIIWNGLKALRHDTAAPPPDEANEIISRFREERIDYVDVDALGFADADDGAAAVHCARVVELVDVEAIRAAKLRVVVDSVHGAGGAEAAALLEHLHVERVHLYAEPTGRFPHGPEPLAENLTDLARAVAEHGAHAGFAQDPDADRLAIVDEMGRYIGEEYTLALCALHTLGPRDVAVANLSTSRMLDDVAERAGARVYRCPVGEAHVAAVMQQHGAVIGGEGNGGVIWPRVTWARDSLAGMAIVLEMLARRGQALSAIVDTIPRYAIVKDKLPVDPAVVARLGSSLGKHFAGQRIDEQDGVRVDVDDAWVHVRPSNTEPILRLFAEAPQQATAEKLIAEVKKAIA